MITALQLIAAGVAPTQANAFAAPLSAACARFGIDTQQRQAAFLGQCMVESELLVHTEEILFYSSPENACRAYAIHFPTPAAAVPYLRNPARLGAFVYAGRNGNGDEASGDGYRYRGRGLLQVTGRANYVAAACVVGRDYVGKPELVAQVEDACLTAAAFWFSHNLNAPADANNIDAVTRAINGKAMLQATRRQQYTQAMFHAIGMVGVDHV